MWIKKIEQKGAKIGIQKQIFYSIWCSYLVTPYAILFYKNFFANYLYIGKSDLLEGT